MNICKIQWNIRKKKERKKESKKQRKKENQIDVV